MPSPVGHLLAGLTVDTLTARQDPDLARWKRAGVVAAAALAPDLDLVLNVLTGRNYHQAQSHSLGLAVVAALLAWTLGRWLRVSAPDRLALAVGLAWLSHVGLDYLSGDTTPPIGLMALWPVSEGWYKSAWPVFLPISRSLDWGSSRQNLLAAAWEAVLLVPLLCAARRLRGRATPD
jgi:membrane-bound metal-dependent hydrolase YbcI (DUF457 family)